MIRFTAKSTFSTFAILFTTIQLSYGEIERADVLMAFTFAAGDGKIGQEADGILEDVTGNGHDGEFRHKPKWAKGIRGAGLQVGQAGWRWNAVTIPHAGDMNLEKFAIGAWVKTEKLIGNCCNMIVSKENFVGEGSRNYSMWMQEQVTVGFTTRNPDNDVQARSIVIADGKWHHTLGTYDGRELIQYVDGVAYGKAPFGGQVPSFHPTEKLHIGAAGPHGFSNGMEGVVDEVVIFRRGLTKAEVNRLMHLGIEKLLESQAVNPHDKMATTWAEIKSSKH